MAESASPAAASEPRRTVRYPSQQLSDRRRANSRVNINEAYAPWSQLDHLPRDAQLDSDELESTALSLDLESGRSHSPADSTDAVRSSWTAEKEDKFLELWQQQECLYHTPANRSLDHKFEREQKWAEIASALELPVDDVKTRASSLRTQYSKLVKLQGRRKKPMTGRQKRILASCDFLKKYINHRADEDNLDQSIKDMVKREPDSSDSDPENRAPSLTDSSSVSPSPQPAKKPSMDGVERQKVALLQHMLEVIEETSRQPERDCEDSFGDTVAMELKRIQNQALRNRVKRQIMTILYDALDSEQSQHIGEESHSITVVIP